MLRINEINVSKEAKDSRVTFTDVHLCIKQVMQKNASAIEYKVNLEDGRLQVLFSESISILTAYKFLVAFDKKRMRIVQANVKRKEIGPFKRGIYEVILS